jgi:hypothetical protein
MVCSKCAVCGVRCAINNRVCRVCLALRARGSACGSYRRFCGLPDALPLPLPGFARPVLVGAWSLAAPALPRGSLPHRWWRAQLSSANSSSSASFSATCPPPPPSPPLPSPLPDRTPLSAFASLGLHGDSGVLSCNSTTSASAAGTNWRSRHRFCRQHAAGAPTMGRTGLPLVPRCGRGCRQFLRAFFLRHFRSSSARIRSSSAESFCSSDTIFSSPSRSFSSRYSRARADSSRFSIYLTPPLFLRVHFVPIRLPLLMRLLYCMRLLRFFIFFVFHLFLLLVSSPVILLFFFYFCCRFYPQWYHPYIFFCFCGFFCGCCYC